MKKIAIIFVLAALSFAAYVQAQPGWGGGGRRGGDGPALTIERDWAIISFDLKVRGDNLRALKLTYQDAWDERKELVAAAQESGDRSGLGEEMGRIQGVLDTSVGNILTEDQKTLFDELRSRGGGGRGGGGRGGR